MATSLDLLPFQPLRFNPDSESCANSDDRVSCKLVQDGDVLQWQFKRKRGIGRDMGCGLFDIGATQLLANSGFTGSAASWTLAGGWGYTANTVAIAIATGSITQTVTGLVDGGMYRVVVTTTATLTGSISVVLGGSTIGTIATGSVAGAYTFFGIAGAANDDLVLLNAAPATCTITSVEMHRVAECFVFTVTSGSYTFDAPGETFTIDGTISMAITLDLEPANPYSVQTMMNLSDVFNGEITVGYGPDILPTVEATNGTNYYTANDSVYATVGISFIDFTGTIIDMSFTQLYSEYKFVLLDSGNDFVMDLTSEVTFCREWINGSVNLQSEGVDYGCYKIGVYDPALHIADFITMEYDFTAGPAPWTETPGADWTLGGSGYAFVASGASGSISKNETTAGAMIPAWVKLRFDTGAVTGTLGHTINVTDGTYQTTQSAAATLANTAYRYAFSYNPISTWDNTLTNGIALDNTTGDDAIITYALFEIYPYEIDFYSTCISYQATHECTKLIYALPGVNMGFNSSNCSFAFIHRIRAAFINPAYKIKGDDFISSEGIRRLISGRLQKVKTLLIDYLDDSGHDAIAGIKMCKTVYIGSTYATVVSDGTRYFIIPDDYNPEWEKDGKYNLSQSRITMIEYDHVKDVTNCQ